MMTSLLADGHPYAAEPGMFSWLTTDVLIAIFAAFITGAGGLAGAWMTIYLLPGKRAMSKAERANLVASTQEMTTRDFQARIDAVYDEMDKRSEIAEGRYRRLMRLEKYLDRDVVWHRRVIMALEEAGITVPDPPSIPIPEVDP